MKQREEFSDIEKWLENGTKIETPVRWNAGSRTPPRRPFDFLASFQKRIPRSKPSTNSFSAHEIDHVSSRNFYNNELCR